MRDLEQELQPWPDLKPEERIALNERIANHPAREANDRWESLQRVHAVLQGNEADLLGVIDAVQGNERFAIEVLQNVRQTDVNRRFNEILIRAAHSYLSAVKMLVDHTRNLMRHYEGHPVHAEYERRKQELLATGRGPFLQKLRDYLIHYRIPPFGTSMQFGKDKPATVTVFVDRDAALEYEDWSSSARRWLRAQPDQVPLRQLVSAYGEDLECLYRWLYGRFEELHSSEIDELNSLIVQLQGSRNTPGHPGYMPPELPSTGSRKRPA